MNPPVLGIDRSQEDYNVLWDNSGQNHHANNNSDQNHHVNPASPMDDNIYQNHHANNNSDQNHHVNPASPMDNYNNYSGLINWMVQVTHVVLGLVTPQIVEQATPLVVEQVTPLVVEQMTQLLASNSAVNQVLPLPLNPPPVMPIADSNQNLPCHQSELPHAYAPFAPQQGVTEEANGIGHGVPMVPQSDQVHYVGSTGTLEIPSSSRPLKRKSIAQTSESYDQSERDTTQITENINPMYNYSGPINLVAQQMIASNSAVHQVPPSPLNPPPVMPIADSNQNLPCHQSEHHHAYAPFAPQQGVTEEANGIGHGVPTVPQSDQVHYGGSTGTLEIPSSSRPLKRKSVAQTGESYDQSERDTTQITENINPAAARMPSNTGSSRSCSRKGKEKVPVPRPRKKNSTRKGETRLDSLQQACNASQQIDSSTDAALSIPPNPKPTSYSLTCSSCYKVKKNLIQENTILHGDMALDAGISELLEKILREYNRTIKYKLV